MFFLFSCSDEPRIQPLSFLSEEYSEESFEIYKENIQLLHNWINETSKQHDSGHYYIFENEVLRYLYFNPKKHIQYGLRYISDINGQSNVKQLIVRTLQCLPLEKYLKLGSEIVRLNDYNLSTVYLSPGAEYGYILDYNYEKKDVEILLAEFELNDPKLAGTISLISSGSNYKRYRNLTEFGEKLPALACSKN